MKTSNSVKFGHTGISGLCRFLSIGSAYIYVKITTPYLSRNMITNRFRQSLLLLVVVNWWCKCYCHNILLISSFFLQNRWPVDLISNKTGHRWQDTDELNPTKMTLGGLCWSIFNFKQMTADILQAGNTAGWSTSRGSLHLMWLATLRLSIVRRCPRNRPAKCMVHQEVLLSKENVIFRSMRKRFRWRPKTYFFCSVC